MWKGIVSDLKTVVDTITSDASKVFGENEGEENGDGSKRRTKLLVDLKRSFNTYASPIEEEYVTEFGNFMTKFTLEAWSGEIKTLLDEEVDISRNYAELVPHKVTPLQFWGRYFFRVHLVENGGVLGLDEVVEEQGNWDDAPVPKPEAQNVTTAADGSAGSDDFDLCKKNLASCLQENTTLKGHVRVLTARVRELEALLDQAKSIGLDPKGQKLSPASSSSSSSSSSKEPATSQRGEEVLSTRQVVADLGDSGGEEEGWGSDEN